ncbi:hypothetical protein, partial [Mesorhizobium silamurunense]|uniref:hypothetical protein n=1 Tax=Mesorhizobium silamurunense TaxID=499528 RepID=UPI001AEEF8FF
MIPDDEETAEETADDLLAHETLDSAVEGEVDEKDSTDQPPRGRFLPSSMDGVDGGASGNGESGHAARNMGELQDRAPRCPMCSSFRNYRKGQAKARKTRERPLGSVPGEAAIVLDVTRNQSGIPPPESAAPQRPGGGIEVAVHQRVLRQKTPEGAEERLRVITVFLVNRRRSTKAPYKDVAYAFQTRIGRYQLNSRS